MRFKNIPSVHDLFLLLVEVVIVHSNTEKPKRSESLLYSELCIFGLVTLRSAHQKRYRGEFRKGTRWNIRD
jgi:hypothetical protein